MVVRGKVIGTSDVAVGSKMARKMAAADALAHRSVLHEVLNGARGGEVDEEGEEEDEDALFDEEDGDVADDVGDEGNDDEGGDDEERQPGGSSGGNGLAPLRQPGSDVGGLQGVDGDGMGDGGMDEGGEDDVLAGEQGGEEGQLLQALPDESDGEG